MRFLALFALVLLAFPALAQDDPPIDLEHFWIQANPNYRAAAGPHCCGPEHCRPVRPDEIVREEDGWLHVPTRTRLKDGQRGIYDSEDGRTWGCFWGENEDRMQCLFPAVRM